MKLKFMFFVFLISKIVIAQDTIISQELYEGKLSTMDISLYLKIYEDGCPRIYATGMYKYKQKCEVKDYTASY